MDKKNFYLNKNYITKDRWNNYWYQIDAVRTFKEAVSVLEIGPGGKIVADLLTKFGFVVKTLDVNENVEPDYVASADNMPLEDKSFDVVLAAEILEHLPFDKFDKTLAEMKRVAREGVVISLPHAGYTFSFSLKVPLLKWKFGIAKIPHFWRTKTSISDHYWEAGLKNYPLRKIESRIKKSGFKIIKKHIGHDDPAHVFFVLGHAYSANPERYSE